MMDFFPSKSLRKQEWRSSLSRMTAAQPRFSGDLWNKLQIMWRDLTDHNITICRSHSITYVHLVIIKYCLFLRTIIDDPKSQLRCYFVFQLSWPTFEIVTIMFKFKLTRNEMYKCDLDKWCMLMLLLIFSMFLTCPLRLDKYQAHQTDSWLWKFCCWKSCSKSFTRSTTMLP